MKLIITTPKRKLELGEVGDIYLPTVDGTIGVLDKHIGMVTALGSGIGHYFKSGEKSHFAVFGGVAKIEKGQINIVTEDSVLPKDVKESEIKEAEDRAKGMKAEESKESADMAKIASQIRANTLRKLKKLG